MRETCAEQMRRCSGKSWDPDNGLSEQMMLPSEIAGSTLDCLASLAEDDAADPWELGSLLGDDAWEAWPLSCAEPFFRCFFAGDICETS